MRLHLLAAFVVSTWSLTACSDAGEGSTPTGGEDAQSTGSSDTGATVDTTAPTDSGTNSPLDTGNLPGTDTTPADDSSAPDDTAAPTVDDTAAPAVDTAAPDDTAAPAADTLPPMDTASPSDSTEPVAVDLKGPWLLVANPDTQEPCGYTVEFPERTIELVPNGSEVSGISEPPGLFITLEFEGTLTGTQLTMQATYTEAGPPSIGWATEHTYTLDVAVTSDSTFVGSYVHELVPNAAEPCTYNWNITGTKQ